jgi:hypothetical protein
MILSFLIAPCMKSIKCTHKRDVFFTSYNISHILTFHLHINSATIFLNFVIPFFIYTESRLVPFSSGGLQPLTKAKIKHLCCLHPAVCHEGVKCGHQHNSLSVNKTNINALILFDFIIKYYQISKGAGTAYFVQRIATDWTTYGSDFEPR